MYGHTEFVFKIEGKPLADSWTIFDNSRDVPKMIAFQESGKIEILDPDLFETLLKQKEGR